VVLAGTLDAVNAILMQNAAILYQGSMNFIGDDSLVVMVNDNGNTGDGGELSDVLEVPVAVQGETLDNWLVKHFDVGDLADPDKEHTVWGDFANADGDRFANIIEYFMGIDPTVADDSGDETFAVTTDGGALNLFFLKADSAPGVSGLVEWSLDGQLWTGDGVIEEIVRDLDSSVLVRARLPVVEGFSVFVRLRVSR
jgi:hypothetical protein